MCNDKKIEELIEKYALLNAYLHNGKAKPEKVLGKVLGEAPEYREKVKDVLEKVKIKVEEINRLTIDEQKKMLEKRWPELLVGKKAEEEKRLPPLPNVEKYGKVVTRFSPNPDCVLHLGSARAAILSWFYAKKIYNGEFYLRFEDTDPRFKRPSLEFYDLIREDLIWLGCKWDKEFIQSDRLEIYYSYAERLIKNGFAYVCTCKPEDFRVKVLAGKPCLCRSLPVEEHLLRWDKMLEGKFDEGDAVVRIKTELNHPNPAIRDWPALRIIDTGKYPHPRVGDKYIVWPLYNFSCGLDDYLLGITHIIRGKEHLTNELRQHYLYKYLGWDYPEAIHYGRLKITNTILSKSKIRLGVEKGIYEGYGDPRLATLIALRRRGFKPEAIVNLMIEVGVKPVDVTISWENLYAINRKLVDKEANRYFFVSNPILLEISRLNLDKEFNIKLHLHPDDPGRGFRELKIRLHNGEARLYISKEDLNLLQPGKIIRLMGFVNIKIEEISENNIVKAIFHSESYDDAKKLKAPLIHYLPTEGNYPAKIIMPNGLKVEGLAEPSIKNVKIGEIIQFERFGFVKVEHINSEIFALFTHH